MFIGALTFAIYAAVAIFAAIMTLREGAQATEGTILHRIAGLLACLVWPLTLVVLAVVARRPAPEPVAVPRFRPDPPMRRIAHNVRSMTVPPQPMPAMKANAGNQHR